jgi:hypothetical protein
MEVTARTMSSARVSLTEVKTLQRTFDLFAGSDLVIEENQGRKWQQHISLT